MKNVCILDYILFFYEKPGNLESTFIELILPFKQNLVLGCVYKHPRMKINEFNEDFLDPVLEIIDKERKTMGDFNINLLNNESDKLVSNFYDLMTSRCFASFILQPTSITEKSKTLIDNIFMNSLESDTFSGNLTTQISDHSPQFLILKNFHRKYTNKSQVVYKRSYKFYNEDEFKKDLLNVNWDETFNNTNADASFDTFLFIINKLLDEHAPLKKLSKREIALKQRPWITKKIKKKMIERGKLFKRYCKSKKTIQKFEIHKKYMIIRTSIVFETNKSKRQYFETFFVNSSNDIKKTWSGIRSLVTLKSTSSSSVSSLTINQKTISDPLTIANSFNEFFTTVGSSLAKKIPKSKKPFFRYLGNKIQNSFFLKPVQEQEIKKIVMKLNSNKSVGPKSLPIKILKSHIDSLAKA